MGEVWFWLVNLLFVLWAVLDGFDFGVGVLHRFVAKTDTERREVLAAIGPVWDGNEVWFLAGAGSMFLAFPKLVAAGLSGLYLPVMFAVWCLMLRGVGIELRSHVDNALWRSFFDGVFQLGSAGFAWLIGVALGNVIRGVPLNASGFFEQGLFATEGEGGTVDGYTGLVGLFVLLTLTAHGANYLRWKTSGEVNARGGRWAPRLWALAFASWLLSTWATAMVAPQIFEALPHRPLAWVGLLAVAAGVGTLLLSLLQKRELPALVGSSLCIAGLLVATVACLYPVLLRSRLSPEFSLTVDNASSGTVAMQSGLVWWAPGFLLAVGSFAWVLKHFRGKVSAARNGEGY
jgi:cytochrome d ubiquinol oxidase subunit II